MTVEAWKPGESLLRIRDVRERTGLGRTTIYRLMAQRRFPRQVQISENTVGWYRSEIDAWIASRPRFGTVAKMVATVASPGPA